MNNQSSLISSDESFQYSDKENNSHSNETIPSYSLLFDKAQQNFSTSSEISLIKYDDSPKYQKENISKRTIIEQSPKFNPFLLLFMSDEQLRTDEITGKIPLQLEQSPNDEITCCASPVRKNEVIVFDQRCQNER